MLFALWLRAEKLLASLLGRMGYEKVDVGGNSDNNNGFGVCFLA